MQRWYLERKLEVTPINPKGGSIEHVQVAANVSEFAAKGQACAISIITPPAVTTGVIRDAHAAGIQHVWMQPGSESAEAVQYGQQHDMVVVHDYCILVSGVAARSQASKI